MLLHTLRAPVLLLQLASSVLPLLMLMVSAPRLTYATTTNLPFRRLYEAQNGSPQLRFFSDSDAISTSTGNQYRNKLVAAAAEERQLRPPSDQQQQQQLHDPTTDFSPDLIGQSPHVSGSYDRSSNSQPSLNSSNTGHHYPIVFPSETLPEPDSKLPGDWARAHENGRIRHRRDLHSRYSGSTEVSDEETKENADHAELGGDASKSSVDVLEKTDETEISSAQVNGENSKLSGVEMAPNGSETTVEDQNERRSQSNSKTRAITILAQFMFNKLNQLNSSKNLTIDKIESFLQQLFNRLDRQAIKNRFLFRRATGHAQFLDEPETLLEEISSNRRKRSNDNLEKVLEDIRGGGEYQTSVMVVREIKNMMSGMKMTDLIDTARQITEGIVPLKEYMQVAETSMEKSQLAYAKLAALVVALRDKLVQMRAEFSRRTALMLGKSIKMNEELEKCLQGRGDLPSQQNLKKLYSFFQNRLLNNEQIIRNQNSQLAQLRRFIANSKSCSVDSSNNNSTEPDSEKSVINQGKASLKRKALETTPSTSSAAGEAKVSKPSSRADNKSLYDPLVLKKLIEKILKASKNKDNPDINYLIKIYPKLNLKTEKKEHFLIKLQNIFKLLENHNLKSPQTKEPLMALINLIVENNADPLNQKDLLLKAVRLVLRLKIGSEKQREKIGKLLALMENSADQKPSAPDKNGQLDKRDQASSLPDQRALAIRLIQKVFCGQTEKENEAQYDTSQPLIGNARDKYEFNENDSLGYLVAGDEAYFHHPKDKDTVILNYSGEKQVTFEPPIGTAEWPHNLT